MGWKDSTSYSQGQKDRKPTAHTIRTEGLTITVTKGHIYYPGVWIMHCHQVGMKEIELGTETEEESKIEAVRLVKSKLATLLDQVNSITTK
jgi:hypothetical protein